jgi:hypothetical protein
MNLSEATQFIFYSGDPAQWLRLADTYIQQYNAMPRLFILPREHAQLKPVIETYARDDSGLTAYVLGFRDDLQDGEQKIAVNALYRKINVRYVQRVRRERLARAIDMAEKKFGTLDYETRLRYSKKLEQAWGKRRLNWLADVRKKIGRRNIPLEEMNDALAVFWKDIDDEIERGEVPPTE